MAAPAAARGRRGRRLLRPSARPPAVPQCRAADAPSVARPSRASAKPHARAACARIASVQSVPGLGQRKQHEQRDQRAGAAAHRLTAVAGITAPLPPLPSPSSHPSTSFPRPLCGEEERAPRPPPSLPAPGAARQWAGSPGLGRAGCGRRPARRVNRRPSLASAHADC